MQTPVAPGSAPAKQPRFASVIAAGNVVEPSEGKKDAGWNIGERPPREYMNWIHNVTDTWVTYFKSWFTYLTGALPAVASNFEIDPATTTGLTLGLKAGSVRLVEDGAGLDPTSETIFAYTAQTKSLTNNTTNYVYWDQGSDVFVTTSHVGAQDRILLYIIVTASGAINWSSSQDCRTPHMAFVPNTYSGTGTSGYVPNPGSASKRYLKDDGTFTRPTPDAQSPTNSDYTFQTTDAWQVVRHTGAPSQNWTVPTNAAQPFKSGDMIFLSVEGGAGAINVLASGGVTILSRGDAGAGPWVVPANGFMGILLKVATNTWQFMVIPVASSSLDVVFRGYVGADGSTNNSLPAGWSASGGGGTYDIVHNLALASFRNLTIVAIPVGTNSIACRYDTGGSDGNTARIVTYTTSTGSAGSTAFTFIAIRNA